MSAELERLALRCIFPGFPGLTAPDSVRRAVAEGLGGVVLFGQNVANRDQVAELTADLRSERSDLLVAVDEEGGDVTRLEAATGSSYPGNLALGVADDVELTERVAAAMAGELAALGVNLDLAPVADVNSNAANPVIGTRAFGSDPELVARHVAAFVRGLQSSGVGACAKHFPGHGDTALDSHVALPVVEATRETLESRELVPFRAAIEAGVQAVMTAHIVVRALGDQPATVNAAALTGLLRDELGFTGLLFTDALEMRAISDTVGVEEGAVRSLASGADAVCLGRDLGGEAVTATREALVGAVRTGRLPQERLAAAAARVDAAAAWAASARGAASEADVGAEVARRALRAQGDVESDRPALVVELVPDPSPAAGEASYGLGDALAALEPSTRVVRLSAPPAPTRLVEAERRLVIVVRDAHRHRWQREVAAALLAEAPDALVVETGVPVWRPAAGSGHVATHGAARVNVEAAAALLSSSRVPARR